MFQAKVLEKIQTRILLFFPPENRAVYVITCGVMRQMCHMWQHNTAHALYMLHNLRQEHTHTHTLGIYNYCFSTATMVTRTRFLLLLYVYWLSCLYFVYLENPPVCYSVGIGDSFLGRSSSRSMKLITCPHSAALGKNGWNYTSTPPYDFMACTGIDLLLNYHNVSRE